MKSVGLFIAGFGAALAATPVALLVWAQHYFTVRPSLLLPLMTTLPGLGVCAAGFLLVWSAGRRRTTG